MDGYQYSYFKSKCINEELFAKNRDTKSSIEYLKQNYHLEINRNYFDIYEYEKLDQQAPLLTRDDLSWQEYYEENCFDLVSDIWPCHYCSLLQNQDTFPEQLTQKDMDVSCLSCKQTTFLPRNIMGCSTDIDLIFIVRNDLEAMANNIKDYIVKESPFYIYDTDFIRTIKHFDGPIDIFVTDLETFTTSLQNVLHQNNWVNTTLYSKALWLPITDHQMNFGADFVVAFEPLNILDNDLEKLFRQSRKRFADKHYIDEVISVLYELSFYHRQLLSNKSILENIEKKLNLWKTYTL